MVWSRRVKVRVESGDETSIRILLGKDEDVRVRTKIAGTIQAPVREGTPVGQRDYMIGDVIVASDPVLTTEKLWRCGISDMRKGSWMKKFWQLLTASSGIYSSETILPAEWGNAGRRKIPENPMIVLGITGKSLL